MNGSSYENKIDEIITFNITDAESTLGKPPSQFTKKENDEIKSRIEQDIAFTYRTEIKDHVLVDYPDFDDGLLNQLIDTETLKINKEEPNLTIEKKNYLIKKNVKKLITDSKVFNKPSPPKKKLKKTTATKKKPSFSYAELQKQEEDKQREAELKKEEDRINKKREAELKKEEDEENDRMIEILQKKEEPEIKFIGEKERNKIKTTAKGPPILSRTWIQILKSNSDGDDYNLTDKQLRQLNSKLGLPTESFKDSRLKRGKAVDELAGFLTADSKNAKEFKKFVAGGYLNKNTNINSLFK